MPHMIDTPMSSVSLQKSLTSIDQAVVHIISDLLGLSGVATSIDRAVMWLEHYVNQRPFLVLAYRAGKKNEPVRVRWRVTQISAELD